MTTLTRIPKEERPRERLLHWGSDALSLTELLAICLGSGRKGHSVLSLAEELLTRFGSLQQLFSASIEALTEVKGIGMAKAIQLKATFALAKRITRVAGRAKYPVETPEDAYIFIASELARAPQETMAVMLRNVKGEIFKHEILGVGTVSEVLIHPREIFHVALAHRAYSMIIAHNHPTGDASPSTADIELTKFLCSAGNVIGVPLDDHLIIGRFNYTSLWESGFVPNSSFTC
ncbi:MAG: DNA repair protein RadC [Chlamydiia bacterium]|nr:DNA repair protein RadC [Chlamydiia bacterium]